MQESMISTANFLKAINDSSHSWQLASVLGFGRKDSCLLSSTWCNNLRQYYSNLFRNDVHQAIQKKRPRKLSKKTILLHDNAHPHTAILMKEILAMGQLSPQ